MKGLSEQERLLVLSPKDYRTLGEADFGVPGLIAHEVIGPFVSTQALGPLIMVHDAVMEPHQGIGHHPHRYNERLFYIVEGAIDHDDALNGITGHMGIGEMGRLTEGIRGMLHKEWNNTDGSARAFILVYETDPTPPRASFALLTDADAPRYEESPGVRTKELVGPRVEFAVHGDVRLFTDTRMEPGAELRLEVRREEAALLYPLEGAVELDEGSLVGTDHAALMGTASSARSVVVRSPDGARLLRVITGPGHGLVAR